MHRILAAAVWIAAGALPFSKGWAADTRLDLATVITKQDAQSALGEPVKDPQARGEEGADGFYARCNYYSENPGKSLVIRVRQTTAGQLEPKKQLDEMSVGNTRFKPIAGLGDQTAIVREGPERGPGHALLLYVAKDKAFITVAISGIDDEKAAAEKARSLAKKVLGKL